MSFGDRNPVYNVERFASNYNRRYSEEGYPPRGDTKAIRPAPPIPTAATKTKRGEESSLPGGEASQGFQASIRAAILHSPCRIAAVWNTERLAQDCIVTP